METKLFLIILIIPRLEKHTFIFIYRAFYPSKLEVFNV